MADRSTLTRREPEVAAAQLIWAGDTIADQHGVLSIMPARGRWVIYRRISKGYRRGSGGNRLPRFHHDTLDAAQVEAARLARENPGSVFVILQEQFEVRAAPQGEAA